MKSILRYSILIPLIGLSLVGFASRANAQIKVSCVGDSITFGTGASSGNSYPSQLQRLLGSGYNVGNFGHGGATLLSTGDIPYINQPEYASSGSFNPAVVVIMLGTNDAKDSNWANHSTFNSDYNNLIYHYRSLPSHPVVCVMTPPAVYGSGFGGNMATTLNNTVVPMEETIASNNIAPVIDVHAATSNHPEWFAADSNHVHPNDAGAACIAQVVSQEIVYLTASTQTFETENLSVAAQTSGITYRSSADSRFSNGNGTFFDATAINQFVTLDVPNIAAATYNVCVGVKGWNNKGTFQLAISRLDQQGSPANVGPQIDEYASGEVFPEIELGSWTPGSTSDKAVRCMITGKDASSTGYGIGLDYLRFIKQQVGGSLSGSFAAGSTSPYNLTTLGTRDWAHWNGTYIHKASGGGQISDVHPIGGGTYGTFSEAARNITWTDGTPVGSGTNDQGYIWCNDTQDAGWTFTVPADTTSRTLNVLFGGATGASVTISAHLSDRSAPDVQSTQTITGGTLSLGTFSYHAATTGASLTITLIKVADNAGPSVDLDAAWLQ
jgi:lysophospholipase L1-like esterase